MNKNSKKIKKKVISLMVEQSLTNPTTNKYYYLIIK